MYPEERHFREATKKWLDFLKLIFGEYSSLESNNEGWCPGLSGYLWWNWWSRSLAWTIYRSGSQVGSLYPDHFTRYCRLGLPRPRRSSLQSRSSSISHSSKPSTSTGGGGSMCCPGRGSVAAGRRRLTWNTGWTCIVLGNSSSKAWALIFRVTLKGSSSLVSLQGVLS